MASKAFLLAVIVAAVVAPATATIYMVGDDDGWKLDVNYTTWAHGKDFRVGDKITFMYNKDYHNVAKVNGDDFKHCSTPSNASNILNTGADTITLLAPGKKWYICSINDHCSRGMKLVINVAAAEGPSPSPTPGAPSTSAAVHVSPSTATAWMVATLAALTWIMA